MHIEVIQTLQGFNALEEEWNDLLSCCSASHVPFLRHEYLTTWWQTRGGGEWQGGELFIVIARDEEDNLIGIAPLFFTQDQDRRPSLMLIGSFEISDYLDVIVRTKSLPEFISLLLDILLSDAAPPWELLDLYNLPDYSPTLEVLKNAARDCGLFYSQEPLQKSPYIPLPGDWETYLAGIDKKQRHEIRRKMRRAEENTPPTRWYIVEDAATLDQEIEDFLSLMAQDPDKNRFLTQAMRSHMRQAVHAAFNAGWLQLAFLETGGEKAAGYLNFDYHGHIWVYNSGLNFAFREISPGWVLLGHLLKWANENQRAAFDFMRGDEDYKYRFGAIDRYVIRATVAR